MSPAHVGFPTTAAAFLLLAVLAVSAPAGANVCEGVPECQEQKKAPLKVKAGKTEGWAFYCSGEYPYYWKWSKDGSCCSVIENPFDETGNPSKLDVTITNWNFFHSEEVTITMGCSKVNQDGPSGCTSGSAEADPKCPKISGTDHNYCSKGPVPACIQTWEERCADGSHYYCTDDLTEVWCIRCSS